MSKNQLFVPSTIKVGYDNRKDTYTGKLAYIIYIDEKGKVRKEASWNSWRDHKLGDDSFENVPTEGFVLNKKVGGYSTGWNHRQSRIRVHDPRGFEFEISIENLLYILENTTSTVGKGLEGNFVYGWDGKDLVLIPCMSPDYVKIEEYNELLRSDLNLTAKTIQVGLTYRNDKEADLIYVGRYDKYENRRYFIEQELNSNKYKIESTKKGKKYWFYSPDSNSFSDYSSLKPFKLIVNDEPSDKTSELIERLFKTLDLQSFEEKNRVYVSLDNEENREKLLKMIYDRFEENKYGNKIFIPLFNEDGTLKHQLCFEKGYSYHQDKDNLYYTVNLSTLSIYRNTGSYYSSGKRHITDNIKDSKVIDAIKVDNNVQNIYESFQTYSITYETFAAKFNEFFAEHEELKSLSLVNYISSVNEEYKLSTINFSYTLIN